MTFRTALALVALWAMPLTACADQPGVCGSHDEPQLRADAGAHRCVSERDCPLPSNLFYCASEGFDLPMPCVRCAQTQCVRSVPEPCR